METYVENLADLLQGGEIWAQQQNIVSVQVVWKRRVHNLPL